MAPGAPICLTYALPAVWARAHDGTQKRVCRITTSLPTHEISSLGRQDRARAEEAILQTQATTAITSELEEHLGPWRSRLAPRLQPVLERHHQSLVALVQSLEQAGHSPDVIRSCVRGLLASYEADLSEALAPDGAAP